MSESPVEDRERNLGRGRRVTVIGAGFSGLVSAYALVRRGFKVTVVEASAKAGGLIDTIRREEGLVETAANALLNSPAVEELFQTVGVPLIHTLPDARKRFIFRNGRARRWPLGFFASLQVLWFGLRYIMLRSTLAPKPGESTSAWAERVMGREASRYLIEAALQGIYAGDPSRMSASLIFSRMFAKPSNPTRKVKRGSVAPPEGMGQLIRGLEAYLKAQGVEFHFNRRVDLRETPGVPHVVAVSGHAAADVIRAVSPKRAAILEKIEFSPVVTTTAFFDGTDEKSQGFGVLFPPVEKRRALGVLKNNFIFPNRARQGFAETWILGGALASKTVIEENDEATLNRVQDERRDSFGRTDKVLGAQITRWPKGIPHYTIELEREIADLQSIEMNIKLIGNYLGDIGLAKILDRALCLPDQLDQAGEWAADNTKESNGI